VNIEGISWSLDHGPWTHCDQIGIYIGLFSGKVDELRDWERMIRMQSM
jgi:hypothetical protein